MARAHSHTQQSKLKISLDKEHTMLQLVVLPVELCFVQLQTDTIGDQLLEMEHPKPSIDLQVLALLFKQGSRTC